MRDVERGRLCAPRAVARGVSRCFLCLLVVAGTAAGARAFGHDAARSPEDRALATGRAASSLFFERDAGPGGPLRWKFGAGEWTLFEVDGLAAAACAVEVRSGRWGVIADAGLLTSPVGRQSSLSGTLLVTRWDRVGLAGGLRLETVALDGCLGESLLSFSIDAVVRMSPRVVMGSRVEGARLAGLARPGADASLRVVVFPRGALSAVAGLAVTRSGNVVCDVASRLRLARSVRAAVGYDDGTAAIAVSLSVGVRALALEAGASVHPVLGVSKSLFVSWRRGPWEG